MALKEIFESLGWKALTFENAAFQLRDASGNRIALMCFHVDDFLMGWNLRHPDAQKHIKALQDAVDFGKWENALIEQSVLQYGLIQYI